MAILRNLIAAWSRQDRLADRIYGHCVDMARAPAHYGHGRIEDTTDGRFDLLVLHMFIMVDRIDGAGPAGAALVQAMIDSFVRDMDRNLREMGAGDVGVAKRMKYMVHALNGQLHAYRRAVAGNPDSLDETLARTMFPDSDNSDAISNDAMAMVTISAGRLATYVRAQRARLRDEPDGNVLAGRAKMGLPHLMYGD